MTDQVQGDAQPESSNAQSETKDKVSYDTYARVISKLKKTEEAYKTLAEEKAKLNEQQLQEQQQWKTLAEQYKQKAEDTSKRLQEQEQQIINGLKFQTFEKHLGGRLRDEEYVNHIPFEKILIDPETRRVDEDSVKNVVSEFTKKHSHLVEFSSGKMPNQAPKAATLDVDFGNLKTKDDIKKAMALVLGKK